MDRKLFGLGQKGFDWAKKKVEGLNEDSPGQHSSHTGNHGQHSSPASGHHGLHAQPSLNQSQQPHHPTGQGPPPYVCFDANPILPHTLFNAAAATTTTTHNQTRNLTVANVSFLGNVYSLTTHVVRDLGFQGQVGPYILLTYGDTIYTGADRNTSQFRGMTSDSMALATHNPLEVIDPHLNENGYPRQFCPISEKHGENMSTCALGITNVVETNPGEGILYFLLNHRPKGVDNLKGAGVATVSLSNTYPPVPTVTRLGEKWWDGDTEPWYGDVCALRHGEYIYAYGHGNPWVYVTRVKWWDATKKECYEYWMGPKQGWVKEAPKKQDLGDEQSVFWQINQGQVIWSPWLGKFLFVYCDRWMNSRVLAKTSSAPEGPWSEALTLYQATPITKGSTVYAAVPHDYFDRSGRTLVVTFTNHPNLIQAVRITFGDGEGGGPV